MTAELKLKIIEAIVDDFYDQQGGGQAALGTLSAINAVLEMDDGQNYRKPMTFVDFLSRLTENNTGDKDVQ